MKGVPGVEVRRYPTVEAFQQDAVRMAASGWVVAAQSEQATGVRGAWVGVAAITLMIGLLFTPLLWIVAVLAFLAAFLDRRRELVVTYRYAIGE